MVLDGYSCELLGRSIAQRASVLEFNAIGSSPHPG